MNSATTAYPVLTSPYAFASGLLLEYDHSYLRPSRQFRLSADAHELMLELLYGFPYSPDSDTLAFLRRFEGVSVLEPGFCDSEIRGACFIVDGSLGGPSHWGRSAADLICRSGTPTVFLSYHLSTLNINGREHHLPRNCSKLTFTNLARSLMRRSRAAHGLIIGREIGARLWDLMADRSFTLLETGFDEPSILDTPVTPAVIKRALSEVLFREATYPWDSVAHSLCAAQAIRYARPNLLWNCQTARELRSRFPDADIRTEAPSVLLDLFQARTVPYSGSGEPLRVLAGTGAHTIGPHGLRFLALDALQTAVHQVGAFASVLTADPEAAEKRLASHIRVLPQVPQQRLPDVFAKFDLYYRVQKDCSVPVGCIEAMATGLPPIMNRDVRAALPDLRHAVNCLLVPHGDTAALADLLQELSENRELLRSVGANGSEYAARYCNIQARLGSLDRGCLPPRPSEETAECVES